MPWFQNLPPEEKELIVSLPFKVGAWMSHAEDVPGSNDDVKEMKVLEHILVTIGKVREQSDYIKAVVRETRASRHLWQKWERESAGVLKECPQALIAIHGRRGSADMRTYRSMLYKIGEAVASAYGEFADTASEKSGFLAKVAGIFEKNDGSDFTNISPGEMEALQQLKRALSVKVE